MRYVSQDVRSRFPLTGAVAVLVVAAPLTVLYVQPPEVPLPPEQCDAAMRALYANAPRARLVRIDDSRHFLQWDQPARFVSEVDALMRR